eukprot:scaffold23081_cov61-Phaeocystis_antarctica.AAC.3
MAPKAQLPSKPWMSAATAMRCSLVRPYTSRASTTMSAAHVQALGSFSALSFLSREWPPRSSLSASSEKAHSRRARASISGRVGAGGSRPAASARPAGMAASADHLHPRRQRWRARLAAQPRGALPLRRVHEDGDFLPAGLVVARQLARVPPRAAPSREHAIVRLVHAETEARHRVERAAAQLRAELLHPLEGGGGRCGLEGDLSRAPTHVQHGIGGTPWRTQGARSCIHHEPIIQCLLAAGQRPWQRHEAEGRLANRLGGALQNALAILRLQEAQAGGGAQVDGSPSTVDALGPAAGL